VTVRGAPGTGNTGIYLAGTANATEDPLREDLDCRADGSGASLSFMRITAISIGSLGFVGS
jgi:hypothetical protein